MTVRAAIALGSNVGDRNVHLDSGVAGLAASGQVVAVSDYIQTAPVGGPPGQQDYLNAVVVLDTDLEPRQLLERCLAIEQEHGRLRRERWGPRTLDLDILLYGDLAIAEPGLEVPHPRMAGRRFVLDPLAQVWPEARYPDGSLVAPRGRLTDVDDEAPSFFAVFVTTGVLAAGLWWLFDLVLR